MYDMPSTITSALHRLHLSCQQHEITSVITYYSYFTNGSEGPGRLGNLTQWPAWVSTLRA